MKPKKLIIFGAGGHAVSVANVALSAGFEVTCFVDNQKSMQTLFGIPIKESIESEIEASELNLAIAIGDNAAREHLANQITTLHTNVCFPSLVHRSVVLSSFSQIGDGTVVMPGAVVGPNTTIGRFCILNTCCSIDHDGSMDDYSSLAPGSVLGGNVTIGLRSAISIKTAIRHGITIGQDCLIGANSFVNQDVGGCEVRYGTPAKVIRMRKRGDPYLQ